MKKFIFLSSLLISFASYAYRVTLSPAELEQLKAGKEITRVEELKSEVFPKVTLINIIPHTPEQNMNVFSDFKNHKKFIPGLVKSDIVNQSANITDVSFELNLPAPASNSKYVTRHTLVKEGKDEILTWDLLKSRQLKATKGSIIFEEFEGKTLFTYITHITPSSSLAWVVKSRVVPDVKQTIKAVIKHLGATAGK
jgi:predicted choloylglycine hydrolase